MAAVTDTPVKGKMLRATKLGPCGDPVLGVGGWPVQVVTKGFVSVEYSAEVDDGEEIDQRDANETPACMWRLGAGSSSTT